MNQVLARGKTKAVERVDHPFERRVRLRNLDDTTAGDGARHEVIAGKAEISTRTTVNVFELLKFCGFPVAYREQDSPTSFIALELDMILLEVVTRGLAWGSYLKRNPKVKEGTPFETACVEFFLKTKGRTWPGSKGSYELPCDDPFMQITDEGVYLYRPDLPCTNGCYFLRLNLLETFPIVGTRELLPVIAATNQAVYEVLEYAWELVGELAGVDITFPDMKIEYGFDEHGQLWIGDVIDAESCRLLVNGEHASKEGFRKGASAELTKLQLGRAADLSDRFPEVAAQVREWVNANFVFRGTKAFPVPRS